MGTTGSDREDSAYEHGAAMRAFRAGRAKILDLLDSSMAEAVQGGISGEVVLKIRYRHGRQTDVVKTVESHHGDDLLR